MAKRETARMYRGSRLHVLDWVERPTFAADLTALPDLVPVEVDPTAIWMPVGRAAPAEARLDTFGPKALPHPNRWAEVRNWWLAHQRGANTPNWDLAVRCRVEGEPGLVLVEVKANVRELTKAGKRVGGERSAHSQDNHQRISDAVAEAEWAWQTLDAGCCFSVSKSYQLANRLALTYKLASLGVPVLLVYLGFTGDEGIRDAGAPFLDGRHSQAIFASHAAGILPQHLRERPLDFGAARAWVLERSREVHTHSPARAPRARLRHCPRYDRIPEAHSGLPSIC